VTDAEQTLKLDLREMKRSATKRPVLVILQGTPLGLTVALEKERTSIGRGTQADVVLRDEIASRLHAEIVRFDNGGDCVEFYINDLDSTNGTFLNGSRVTSDQLLQDGDKIKVGNHLMKFALLDEYEAEFQERLHRMTETDELTGLRSRRSLFAHLDQLVSQSANSDAPQPLSILMLDLDFFKRINDAHGHLVGSQTIKEVGHIIRDCLGSADLAARYGGEEYLAYFPGAHEEGVKVAERIRKSVEGHAFSSSPIDPSQTMHITISVGLASFPKDGRSALELVQKADQALYRAKLSGRNRTCAYDRGIDRPDAFRPAIDASAIIYGPADAQ
jgi:two-component system cell cycle response regulator